jgi:DNA-binding transcriptional ArsR family regulator
MERNLQAEVAAIRLKLDHMHEDLKRFMERSNQQQLAAILDGCRSDFSEIILGYATGEMERGLEGNMVRDCQMRDACKALFSDLLKENLSQIREGRVSEESIEKIRSRMERMREKAPYEQCHNCFFEVSRLLHKQLDLMRSLRLYRERGTEQDALAELPEEGAVDEILEPLGNKQRLQILKALCAETGTFSSLSQLTGLRGGNLLFHLQKLLDSGMILQMHERGGYMITERGFKALEGIAELYLELNGGGDRQGLAEDLLGEPAVRGG